MRKIKTEHTGAKNGGGFWGPRAFAKYFSRKQRRSDDKRSSYEEALDQWKEQKKRERT